MAANVVRRCQDRVLDGARTWGAAEVRLSRFGVTQYRLLVYPPGLNRSERRWLRLWRGWPLWGVLAWLVCMTMLTWSMSRWAAVGVSTVLLLASGAVAAVRAGDARTRVRVLVATTMAGYADPDSDAARDRVQHLADVLIGADQRLAGGEISVVDHEFVCWQVYDQLMPERTKPHERP